MYSILICTGTNTFRYATNADGQVFQGDAEAAKTKLLELLETNPIGKLSVVHNVTLTAELTIEDVA